MAGLNALLAVAVLVGLVWLFRWVAAGRHTVWVSALYLLVPGAIAVSQAYRFGPAWAVPVTWAVLGLGAPLAMVALLLGRFRIVAVQPAFLRQYVRHAAQVDGPQYIGLCVFSTGVISLTIAEPFRRGLFSLEAGCQLCFLEDQVKRIMGEDTPAVAEYRAHLRAGSNRNVIIKRMQPDAPWQVVMRSEDTARDPLRASACPVHGPLTAGAR
ncbi:hypothetical protein [Kitasatospora sp. NBC_01266]|uniref:hypothetical protein n=1 Tax=Kitasatospora sp. NBC_01266 TaxID=2903572 RepID=UPI002E34CD77|nr:hypothetical protein [Kitasatospora sp. NBC_01266]